MAISWSFGAVLSTPTSRFYFSDFLRDQLLNLRKLLSFGQDLIPKQLLSDDNSDYFGQFYHCERAEWLRWDYELDKFKIAQENDEKKEDDTDEREEIEF